MEQLSARDWIIRFHEFYFQKRKKNVKSEYTYKVEYHNIFKRLEAHKPLTAEEIIRVCIETEPDTRQRKRAYMSLSVLAKFAKINVDLDIYKGCYTARSHSERKLPSDNKIAQTYHDIQNPKWQWVYGMMAAYGLRNHEVFRLDFKSLKDKNSVIRVLSNSKTGSRRVWCFFPEWFEQWELWNVNLPNINVNRGNPAIGHTVSQYFRRNVGFRPYDLRHCWAIRTLEFELDISLAAQQMGHSLKVHSELYHHWIVERHHQRAYEIAKNNPNRPPAPGF